MTSATNPRQIAAREKQRQIDAASERIVIQSLMSTVAGRRWMWLRLEQGQVFADGGSLDLGSLAWERGRRTMGLELFRQTTRHTPDLYVRMTNENSSAQLKDTSDDRTDDTDA